VSEAVQQPLYADGWRDNQPHMRQPGETEPEFVHRQFAQLRELLDEKRGVLRTTLITIDKRSGQ
jgi:hypothetical protein